MRTGEARFAAARGYLATPSNRNRPHALDVAHSWAGNGGGVGDRENR